MNFITSIGLAAQNHHLLSLLFIFVSALIEALPFLGLIFPGGVILGFLGFLIGQSALQLNNYFWAFLIGTLLGDVISFYLGRKGKVLVSPSNKYLQAGNEFIKNHGAKGVFIGRFLAPTRPIIALAAGAFKMKFQKFMFWNVLAAIVWIFAYGALGYFFGQVWQVAAIWTTRAAWVIIGIAIFIFLIWMIRRSLLKYGALILEFIVSISISIKDAIISNSEVRKLVARFPRFFKFLNNRFDNSHFAGRPLTYLAIAFIYFLAVFLGMVENVINSEAIVGADVRIENLLYVFRSRHLVGIFLAITLLGKSYIVIAGTAVLTVGLWLYRKHRQIIGLWVAMAGSAISAMSSKILIQRARPAGVAVYSEDTFSFPSGHATLAVVFYGYIIYLYWLSKKTWKVKLNAWFGGITLIILIGFSRLYLGVHYLSDVLGGFLLGMLWLIIGITITEWLIHRDIRLPIPAAPKVNKLLYLSGMVAAWLMLYSYTAATFQPPRITPTPPEKIQILTGSDILDVFDQYQLSKYSETLSGRHQAPISFIIAATDDEEFIQTMESADWLLADEVTPSSIWRIARQAALNKEYDRGPMTPSFWNADVHDLGFQKPTEARTIRERHHARFWRTELHTNEGKNIYVGTASHDIGLKWFVAHSIDPAIDIERDLLFNDLLAKDLIQEYRFEQFTPSSLGENAAGDPFFSDGKVYILELK